MCPSGHPICNNCICKVSNKCPTCKVDYPPTVGRNYPLEELIAESVEEGPGRAHVVDDVSVKCIYCKRMVSMALIEKHEQSHFVVKGQPNTRLVFTINLEEAFMKGMNIYMDSTWHPVFINIDNNRIFMVDTQMKNNLLCIGVSRLDDRVSVQVEELDKSSCVRVITLNPHFRGNGNDKFLEVIHYIMPRKRNIQLPFIAQKNDFCQNQRADVILPMVHVSIQNLKITFGIEVLDNKLD